MALTYRHVGVKSNKRLYLQFRVMTTFLVGKEFCEIPFIKTVQRSQQDQWA